MTAPLFVYGSLRKGGALERYLPGERTLATLWGWSLFGLGATPGLAWYPVAIEGGSGVVVGEVVDADWGSDEVERVIRIETGAGYVLRPVTVTDLSTGHSIPALTFAWEDQDHDWIQPRIESGDWLTFCEVGR